MNFASEDDFFNQGRGYICVCVNELNRDNKIKYLTVSILKVKCVINHKSEKKRLIKYFE